MEDIQATHSGNEKQQQSVNIDISKLVSIDEDKTFTTSLVLAEVFEKQHKNVLQSIEGLECSPAFNKLNFQPVEYVDAKGEKRPAFHLTRDGFSFLAMGFTGSKAAAWKEKFLEAFNKMEAELLRQRTGDESEPLPKEEIVPAVEPFMFRTRRKITERQRKGLIGALHAEAFWQGIGVDEAEKTFLVSMSREKIEDLDQGSFMEGACVIIRRFFMIRKQNEKPQGMEEATLALHGLMEFWQAISNNTRKDITNYVLNRCRISRLEDIVSEQDMRRALFALWGGFANHVLRERGW